MINMKNPKSRFLVYVKSNADFVFVETYSGYWNFLPDPEGKRHLMLSSCSDSEIGTAIFDALAASRRVDPQVNREFFDVRGRVALQYAEWVDSVMKGFGYKSKRVMFNDMKSCSVELVGDSIVIIPSHHEKLEAWSGKDIDESDHVVISSASSPSEVGAGLRLAMNRCT